MKSCFTALFTTQWTVCFNKRRMLSISSVLVIQCSRLQSEEFNCSKLSLIHDIIFDDAVDQRRRKAWNILTMLSSFTVSPETKIVF